MNYGVHWFYLGFIAVMRYHGYSHSREANCLTWAGLKFRGSVCYYHGRKHDDMQADTVL